MESAQGVERKERAEEMKAVLLDPTDLERAGCFWVEVRTLLLRTYVLSPHVVRKIKGDYVFMESDVGNVAGQLSNYNIGWRAWLMRPDDEQRKSAKWKTVARCNGVGYGWAEDVICSE